MSIKTLAIGLVLLCATSFAQQPAAPRCDRACLQRWVDNYLVAMRDQKNDPALFAPDLKFTENGIRLPFGKEGLWYDMSGIGKYKFYIPDIETQQVAFLGRCARRARRKVMVTSSPLRSG